MFELNSSYTNDLIKRALYEDIGDEEDLTSTLSIGANAKGSATIQAKATGVLAGVSIAQKAFEYVDNGLDVFHCLNDGDLVEPGTALLEISGQKISILTAERTALNFLQRLSGIATLTAKFVDAMKGTPARILDTRKTTPGLRILEKSAVRAGGGYNHRFGLNDMILLKENHILAAGSITEAVSHIREEFKARHLALKIEVETQNLGEVKEALSCDVDRIMLDNMTLEQIREAIAVISGRIETEASGNINLDNVRSVAETGVDYISVGALTHSAKILDMTLLLQ